MSYALKKNFNFEFKPLFKKKYIYNKKKFISRCENLI